MQGMLQLEASDHGESSYQAGLEKRQKEWDDAYELHRIRAKGGLEELQPSLKMRKAFVGFSWVLCLTCIENKCRDAVIEHR